MVRIKEGKNMDVSSSSIVVIVVSFYRYSCFLNAQRQNDQMI